MLGDFLSNLSNLANDPNVNQGLSMGLLKGRQEGREEAEKEFAQKLKRAAQKLSARGFSQTEIADVLGVDAKTVSRWI